MLLTWLLPKLWTLGSVLLGMSHDDSYNGDLQQMPRGSLRSLEWLVGLDVSVAIFHQRSAVAYLTDEVIHATEHRSVLSRRIPTCIRRKRYTNIIGNLMDVSEKSAYARLGASHLLPFADSQELDISRLAAVCHQTT